MLDISNKVRLSLELFPFTKDFYHLEGVVCLSKQQLHYYCNYLASGNTGSLKEQKKDRRRRNGLGLSLDQGAHAHGDKLDILPVAIANINIVNVTNKVQNYIVFSNAKQSHQIDTVVSQNERRRLGRLKISHKNYNKVIALSS